MAETDVSAFIARLRQRLALGPESDAIDVVTALDTMLDKLALYEGERLRVSCLLLDRASIEAKGDLVGEVAGALAAVRNEGNAAAAARIKLFEDALDEARGLVGFICDPSGSATDAARAAFDALDRWQKEETDDVVEVTT